MSAGHKARPEGTPVKAPIMRGCIKRWNAVDSPGNGSGKRRFSCSFTPKAAAFSIIMPVRVACQPFQRASVPSVEMVRLKPCKSDVNSDGLDCIRTFRRSGREQLAIPIMRDELGEMHTSGRSRRDLDCIEGLAYEAT